MAIAFCFVSLALILTQTVCYCDDKIYTSAELEVLRKGGSLGDVEMVENNNTDVQNITLGGRFLTNVPCKGELKRIHSKCVKVYQNSP